MKTKNKKKFRNYWESHNIPAAIGRHAEKLGLECIATGGGCDFIYKEFRCGAQAVLSSLADCGFSPDTLDEPSRVTVYQKHDPNESAWMTGVEYEFKDARAAMRWMRDMKPIACWPEVDDKPAVSEQQRLAEMFRKKHKEIKGKTDWPKYIRGLGLKMVSTDIKKTCEKPRELLLDLIYKGKVGDNIVVDNPGHHCGYILVPRDFALKALALEGLP